MHGQFKKSGKDSESFFEKWGAGFLVLPALIVVALLVLAVFQPKTSNWIAETVQAEFSGDNPVPADAPARIALPGLQMRTVSSK